MRQEGSEKEISLSAEQHERLDEFLEGIRPLIEALVDSNESSCADEIDELTEEFKQNNADIPGKYIDNRKKEIKNDIEELKLVKA